LNPPRSLLCLLAIVVAPPPASAQQPAPAAVVKEIQAVEDDWARAYQSKDATILERILAPEYCIVWAPDGSKTTKADDIRGMKSSTSRLSSVRNPVDDVRLYGDMAIVYGRYLAVGTDGGKPVNDRDRWMTVFGKRNGKWVALSSLSAPMALPGK
jgi:ketosteroid isomerase-like protein